MYHFESILQQIEEGVNRLSFPHPPKSLYEPIKYILSLGGKRIRPALTLMAYNIYKEDTAAALDPALGIEVFHNFTLLHDDLMDEADMRRNKKTVHKVWDANTAILSGDAMLIVAYQLIGKTKSSQLKCILDLFSQTALEICSGQQYDMEFESRQEINEEEYLEMIRLKTAVLLACSLKTGALLADAPLSDTEHLYSFGNLIGIAFQLQDDLLDVYGDPAVFGKNIGGDILCNKKTFLLVNALKKASNSQAVILNEWMKKETFNPTEKIDLFTSIYDELQLKEMTRQRIEEYYSAALQCLDKLTVGKEKLEILKGVCDKLMFRNY